MFVITTEPVVTLSLKDVGERSFTGNVSFENPFQYTSTSVEVERTVFSTGDPCNLFVERLPNRYSVRNKFLERRLVGSWKNRGPFCQKGT